MKLYKLYESVLGEEQIQACVAKFGSELFSPQFGGAEPNTALEDEYVELIHRFSGSDFGTRIKPEFIDMVQNLKTCVSSYPEILYPDGMAHRGINVDLEDLLKSFDKIQNEVKLGQPFKMVYNAKNPIQSWTESEDIANDKFARTGLRLEALLDKFDNARKNGTIKQFLEHVVEYGLDIDVPVVIRFRVTPKDFLFKGKYFSHLSMHDEDEILRIDNRPIDVLAKIHPPKLSARVYDLLKTIHEWE